MKKQNILLGLVLFMFIASPVYAIDITTDNQSRSNWTDVWGSAYAGENRTWYIHIPKVANVTNAQFNLTGGMYYNRTNYLLGDATSTTNSAGWTNPASATDGNTVTYANGTAPGNWIQANFTLNESRSDLWQIQLNYFLTDCGNQVDLEIRNWTGASWYNVDSLTDPCVSVERYYLTRDNFTDFVDNETNGNISMRTVIAGLGGVVRVNEIFLTSFAGVNTSTDVTVYVNESAVFTQTGVHNFTNRTADFSAQMMSVLSTCTATGGYCDVPINITVDSIGNETIDDINISYQSLIFLTNNYTTPVLEGSIAKFNMSLNTSTGVNNSEATLMWNGTAYAPDSVVQNGYIYSYYKDLIIPEVDADINITFWWNATIDYETYTEEDNSTINNQTILDISLSNCTGGDVTLNFSFYDEYTDVATNSSFNFTFWYWTDNKSNNKTLSEIHSGNWTYLICISPQNATIYADMFSEYYTGGYSYRNYFLDNATLTNTTTSVPLYLLNATNSTLVTFTVRNQAETPQPNIYIQAQKYIVGTNTYRLVAMGKTDSEGQARINLDVDDTYYKFLLTQNGAVIRSFEPMQITSTSLTLHTTQVELPSYYEYWRSLAHNCTFNNATNYFRCTFSDTSGKTQQVNLTMWNVTTLSRTEVCHQTTTSSSATLSCYLGANVTGHLYEYQLIGRYCCSEETWWILASGWEDFTAQFNYGSMGILMTIFLIIMFAGLGMYVAGLSFAIIGVDIGLILASVLGILTIGMEALTGIIIVSVIIAYLVKG